MDNDIIENMAQALRNLTDEVERVGLATGGKTTGAYRAAKARRALAAFEAHTRYLADVRLVMNATACTETEAVAALEAEEGNVAEAIIDLLDPDRSKEQSPPALLRWVVSNLLTESQLSTVPPGSSVALRFVVRD
jgi:hypothetical protein